MGSTGDGSLDRIFVLRAEGPRRRTLVSDDGVGRVRPSENGRGKTGHRGVRDGPVF